MTKLTDTQKQTIRIALAKWMGWTELQEIEDCLAGLPPNAKWLEDIPNYPGSLDCCHAIEVKLTDEEHREFRHCLDDMTGIRERDYISSGADLRSLAIFRSLNLGELGD